MWKKMNALGMVGVLVYVAHVVLGGILWKGYSHLMQPISDLTASGAPNKDLLTTLTWIYGVCSILFAISAIARAKGPIFRTARFGLMVFLAMHLVSITYGLFPQDLPGAEPTFTGIMHLVVTALIVPLTILAPFLTGFGLRRVRGYSGFGTYSIITGFVILIAGATTAVFFAQKLPYFGLVERINIGTLQLWTFLMSLRFYTTSDSPRNISA